MRVSAYNYTDYGTLQGTVISIAADATSPQGQVASQSNSESASPYFDITIQPELTYLTKGNRKYQVKSGMEVQADILSKEETVLTFILRKARILVGI
jgi:multidrug efflux pump subunit AcrA (membrane-fusion protein)